MGNKGRVVARDTQPERLKFLEENIRRLATTCVEISNQAGQFDRILVDAPCSNTAVLRRRVDLRWRIQPDEIIRLSEAQSGLLAEAAALLKSGVLVYSTCSLEPEENEQVTRRFLEQHPNFKLESERQLLPFVDGVDGAYVARFRC
jgi:16S rRNA (cytosine967-C5)-methyltransferase